MREKSRGNGNICDECHKIHAVDIYSCRRSSGSNLYVLSGRWIAKKNREREAAVRENHLFASENQ